MNEREESNAGLRVALMAALQARPKDSNLAAEMAKRGSIDLEFYSPHLMDLQQPHDRDELYMIARGEGTLEVQGERITFVAGDVLFVPAYAQHRFVDFSNDFGTWVIFYGPVGGEQTVS